MLRALVIAAVGALVVAAGLALGPVPWLALVWLGAVLMAAGLFADWGDA